VHDAWRRQKVSLRWAAARDGDIRRRGGRAVCRARRRWRATAARMRLGWMSPRRCRAVDTLPMSMSVFVGTVSVSVEAILRRGRGWRRTIVPICRKFSLPVAHLRTQIPLPLAIAALLFLQVPRQLAFPLLPLLLFYASLPPPVTIHIYVSIPVSIPFLSTRPARSPRSWRRAPETMSRPACAVA
jgi:hypothetical protein